MADAAEVTRRIERHAAQLHQEPGSRVFAQLAEAYRKEGLLDEAIRICREGLEAHPGYTAARVVLGRALVERGALNEAERELRRVLAEAPDNLLAIRLLGDVLSRQGRLHEARELYRKALTLNPQDRESQAHLLDLEKRGAAPSPEPEQVVPPRAADPLASPTLAALYASQGYEEMAERLYEQVRHRPDGAIQGAGGEPVGRVASVAVDVLARLLAMRQAARRVREARQQPGRLG